MKRFATLCAFWLGLCVCGFALVAGGITKDLDTEIHWKWGVWMGFTSLSFAGLVWGMLGVVEKRGGK